MKRYLIITVLAMQTLLLVASAFAGENGSMKGAMWQRQRSGVQGVIDCFRRGAPASEYEPHLFNIASAETNLMAYRISPKDPNLVSRFAEGVKTPADYPVFGWRLVKWQLERQSNVRLSADGPFRGKSFAVESATHRYPGTVAVKF